MNFKRLISLLMTAMIIMAMPFTSFADDDEDYCYDESAFVQMTPEEISTYMLELGIGLNKISLYSTGSIVGKDVFVVADRNNKQIGVFFYTDASMVANEIGVRNLKFFSEKSNTITLLRADAKLYTGFQQSYSGGYYYTAPEPGKKYYAVGTNFAIFTYTEKAYYTTSDVVTY